MPFRRLVLIALLALPQARARSDDILYDYSGDVLPSDPASGWIVANPCEGSCTELIENGRFVLFWPVPGDRAAYGHFIAVAPQQPPPHPLNAVDLSGRRFRGWFWRRIRRELVAVLVDTRGENRYNSRIKRASRHAGCGRKK